VMHLERSPATAELIPMLEVRIDLHLPGQ
jgi:hypothetical protein